MANAYRSLHWQCCSRFVGAALKLHLRYLQLQSVYNLQPTPSSTVISRDFQPGENIADACTNVDIYRFDRNARSVTSYRINGFYGRAWEILGGFWSVGSYITCIAFYFTFLSDVYKLLNRKRYIYCMHATYTILGHKYL